MSEFSPAVWPACSECDVAYVLRRMMSIREGWLWLWQRDCKHKNAEAVVVVADNDLAISILEDLA